MNAEALPRLALLEAPLPLPALPETHNPFNRFNFLSFNELLLEEHSANITIEKANMNTTIATAIDAMIRFSSASICWTQPEGAERRRTSWIIRKDE